MKHLLGNIMFILRHIYKAQKNFIFVCLTVHTLQVVTPLTSVLGLKLILDALINKADFPNIIIIVIVYCLLNVLKGVVDSWYYDRYIPVASAKISQYMDIELMSKIVKLDLKSFDNSEFYSKYTRAKNEISTRPIAVASTVCEIFGGLLSILTLIALVMMIDSWLILCVIIGTIFSFIIDVFRSKLFYKNNLEVTLPNRKIAYVQRIFYEPQYLKEMRLFRINKLGFRKYKETTDVLTKILKRQGVPKVMLGAIGSILHNGLFVAAAFLYLAWNVIRGAIGIGDFSAMYTAVFQLGNEMYTFASKFSTIYQHSLFIDNLIEVINSGSNIERGGERTLDSSVPHGITFKNVSFSYSNDAHIFNNVSFDIKAGEKTAIVGYNGAGKSTLVKLMTRLYDPDSGEILIDGINVKEYSTVSLRDAFGVVMQDFQHYAFTLAENMYPDIDLSSEQDIKLCHEAIREAGLNSKVSRLPKGILTSLSGEFEGDGVELSGGEYQKLSFARTCVNHSHILLLDEVSSALDPLAESQINDTMLLGSDDKTVIFISHRLSAAKYSDHIIMLDRGRVVEDGTHDTLISKSGQYAEIFLLQAEKYV